MDYRLLLHRLKCLRPLVILATMLASGIVFGWALLSSLFYFKYSHEIVVNLPSPTGEWTAVVREEIVDGPPLLSSVTAGVTLISTIYPTWTINILGVDTSGHDENRPRIFWSKANVLRVTVPNLSYLKVLTRHADGIDVDLHFEPDDPEARAAWLKQIGEPPE